MNMDDEYEEAEPVGPDRAARGRRRRFAAGAAGFTALVLGIVWMQRAPIADYFLTRQLAARGVAASYDVMRIGPRTQRLENLVLGDPARPDLTARWVEVDVGYAGLSPAITAVRAQGVRLHGRYGENGLSLGVLDKLLGEGGGTGPVLPDIDLTLVDGRARFDTDYGWVGVAVNGAGRLYGGFRGAAALAAPALTAGECRLAATLGQLGIETGNGRLQVKGPVRAEALACGERLALTAPEAGLDLRFARSFDGLSGAITLASPALHMAGTQVTQLSGLIAMEGPFTRLEGSHSLSVASLRTADARAGKGRFGGRFALRLEGQDKAASVSGDLRLDDVAPADPAVLQRLERAAAQTPLAPLAGQFARALGRAGAGNRLSVSGTARWTGLGGEIALSKGRLVAENGARVDMDGPARLVVDQARGRWQGEGALSMGGGDLPTAGLAIARGVDGTLSGRFAMEPYAAGSGSASARLALAPTPFLRRADGSGYVRTQITLDGPLPGGAVRGLALPLDVQLTPGGGAQLAGGCMPLRWQSLTMSSAQFDPATLRLCSDGDRPLLASGARGLSGGFALNDLALDGRVGESPLRLRAGSARLTLDGLRFALADAAVRLGDPAAPVMIDATHLAGAARGGGFGGTLAGGHARIGAVPLDLAGISAGWTFAANRLALDGAMTVSDTQADPRFVPLSVPDAHLVLIDGRIGASGTLRQPRRDRSVATVKIAHDLSAGRGSATFDLGKLVLGPGLQPEDLTPLTLGVVANVAADIAGEGRIDWDARGVTSSGTFSTSGASFAAAFGPVEGFGTVIRFDDLLGLRTAPGQVATIASTNPGIEVRDGVIQYALLSPEQARIEGGHWPFAGGVLELLPATLDLDARRARHLAFRVRGLDAGAFINTLDLKDISATGTYDGLLPMIFDHQGGRIEGGILVARQPGLPPLVVEDAASLTVQCDPAKTAGTLSYVGAISNEQLGAIGTLAFEALKNLRYKCLTILLDGALDGEFVTRIAVNGVNQGTPAAARSLFARPFLGLPFIFNVKIEAPFRGLLNTAQSFIDPSNLIRENLGPQYQTVLDGGAPGAQGSVQGVQPPESDKGVVKDRK